MGDKKKSEEEKKAEEEARHKHDDEAVDEASKESFPASDAPAWTPTSAGDGHDTSED